MFQDHTSIQRPYQRVGLLLAGDLLTPASNTYTGSNGNDHLTTFGLNGITTPDIETLNGGGGDDVLTYIAGRATLAGGTGNDTFVIAAPSIDLRLDHQYRRTPRQRRERYRWRRRKRCYRSPSRKRRACKRPSISNIDGVRFADPQTGAIDKAISFNSIQTALSLSDTLTVTGSISNTANIIIITRAGTSGVNVDLSGWQFTNFSRANQTVSVALTDIFGNEPLVADQVIGTSRIDFISTGRGNDTLRGGLGADSLDGGTGDDLFIYGANDAAVDEFVIGGAGIDTIQVNGNNNFTGVDHRCRAHSVQCRGDLDLRSILRRQRIHVHREWRHQSHQHPARPRGHPQSRRVDIPVLGGNRRVAVIGSARNDDVTGTIVNDNFAGLAGRDLLAGNNGNDVISGGDGVDILSGDGGNDNINGGAGIDIIEGGAGNDILNGASEADTIDGGAHNDNINGGDGHDTLEGGDANDIVNGGAGSDRLDGGTGNDNLDGGTGADVVSGGIGNDTYKVDHALDQVFDDVGGGIDTVIASASFTLTEGSEINLLRTTAPASTAPIHLTGNAFGQTIQGNAASNVIAGKRGNDTLTGNAGNDVFLFDTPLSAATNKDSITDFVAVNDAIRVDNDVFVGLAAGTLSAAAFRLGSAAADPTDRIIYNQATGALIFDFKATPPAAPSSSPR